MNTPLFREFLISGDTLWVYEGDRRLFTSNKGVLLPLLEYIDKSAPCQKKVTILDRIMGNAAALLSVKADANKVYSPLGSELATNTLDRYNVEYHLSEIVPFIRTRDGKEMCPMEKLSISRDMSPDEFYKAVKHYYG
jgi:hypothetical protein